MVSLVNATSLWGYSALVRELGGDPKQHLARLQIPANIEKVPDAFITFKAAARLLETTADDLSCPDFGLRLSRLQGLGVLGPIAVIVRNTEIVRDALTEVAKHLNIHSPALRLAVIHSGTGCDLTLTYETTEPAMGELRQTYELSMANLCRIVSLVAGPDADLAVVSFKHEQPLLVSCYQETLGCSVLFRRSRCGLHLPASLANRPIDRTDEQTLRIATRYLETEWVPYNATFADQVCALTRRLLPIGRATAEAIAHELAIHPRTLQRRLADEGIRCHDILDEERRKQAVRYLSEPRLSLGQITHMLGYAEQSSMNRACRRWFGQTPREHRADLRR